MKFDERTIRLIAVGASVAANCQPCLLINTTKARENGADDQEIAEAIEIGKMVRTGASSKMDKFAATLIQTISETIDTSNEACGCKSTYEETTMKDVKVLNKRYATITWGILFILLGVLMLIPGDQNAIFVLGAGVIMLGLNLARSLSRIPVSAFSITLGTLAVVLGLYTLLRPLLHAPHIEVDFIPLVLIVIGLYVLIPSPKYADNK